MAEMRVAGEEDRHAAPPIFGTAAAPNPA